MSLKTEGAKRRGNETKSWKLWSFKIQVLKTWRFNLKRARRKRTKIEIGWDALREVRKDAFLWPYDKEVTQAKSIAKEAYRVRTFKEKYWS